MMVQGNELLCIDVGEISCGHPYFDIADVYLAVKFNEDRMPDEKYRNLIGFDKETGKRFWERYVQLYFPDKTPDEIRLLEKGFGALGQLRRSVFASKWDLSILAEDCSN